MCQKGLCVRMESCMSLCKPIVGQNPLGQTWKSASPVIKSRRFNGNQKADLILRIASVAQASIVGFPGLILPAASFWEALPLLLSLTLPPSLPTPELRRIFPGDFYQTVVSLCYC